MKSLLGQPPGNLYYSKLFLVRDRMIVMNEKDLREKFNKELEEKQSDKDISDHPINKDESSEENNIWNLLLELYGLTYDKCVKMVDEKPEVYACKTNPYTEGAPYGMSFYPGGEKAYEREGPDGKASQACLAVDRRFVCAFDHGG